MVGDQACYELRAVELDASMKVVELDVTDDRVDSVVDHPVERACERRYVVELDNERLYPDVLKLELNRFRLALIVVKDRHRLHYRGLSLERRDQSARGISIVNCA